MRERPILFNGDMVRAILDGRKTVTRRPMVGGPLRYAPCPLGIAWDRLWVRETFASCDGSTPEVVYRADGAMPPSFGCSLCRGMQRWRPSIHMPRWASRITLTVTSVDMDRLSGVTNDGAKAEGFDSRAEFLAAWDVIYGDAAEDPWVWVVGFEREVPRG